MSLKNCNIIQLEEVSSTNTYAAKLLKEGRPDEGSMISAGYQTSGKGQGTNSWESEADKNILASIIFYPDFLPVSEQFSLSMTVALGIIDFLGNFLPREELFIKWPNDIYFGNKKIGGILINIEVMGDRFEYVIAGIGININQTSFSSQIPNPVSLSNISGENYSLQDMTSSLHNHLTDRYNHLKQISYAQLRLEYHQNLLGMGEWRDFNYQNKQIEGKIKGINEFGHLILDTESGLIECDLKEVEYLF